MIDDGIGSWATRRAFLSGDAVALVEGEERLTYAELEARATGIARRLRRRGIRKGDRIAAIATNGLAFLELLFATAKLGAIFVPINTRLSAAEAGFILVDSGADVLLWSPQLREVATDALATPGARVRIRLTVGQTDDPDVETLDAVVDRAGESVVTPVSKDDVALLIYTSGTTGAPKGAMLTHGNLLWNVINALTVGRGLTSADRTVTVAPLFHIAGLGVHTLPLLYVGGTVVLQASFDPERTLELMERERVTVQLLVPAMWGALMQVPDFDRYDLSSLERAVTGSAPTPLRVLDFFINRGIPFQEGFGMTETSPGISFLDAPHMRTKLGTIGRAMFHVETRIVGAHAQDVPAGEVGELVVRGPNVFAGYWNRPDQTAAAFRDGWFHTGDLVVADEEGFMTLVDRKKDMLISGGENVYPAEVERTIHSHPAVRDVAVVGVPHDKWGETPLAVVITVPGAEVTEAELIAYTRARLAHFKCPTRVEFVADLPRNATGKVLKRDLRLRFAGIGSAVGR